MSEQKTWMATEGMKRADVLVRQLALEADANGNPILPIIQHRMVEKIGYAIDAALHQYPAIGDESLKTETIGNGMIGGERKPFSTVTLTSDQAAAARDTAVRDGISEEEAYRDAAVEKLGRASPTRPKRKGGRRKAAGAEA